jgi:small subunit ribosomal protein S3
MEVRTSTRPTPYFRALSSSVKGLTLLEQDSALGSETCAAGDSPSAAPPTVAANSADCSEELEKLRKDVAAITGGEVHLNIVEIRKPEADTQLIAENITAQLERRIAFRRAMKRAMQSAMRLGAKGIRINVAGRLGGAEIARMEWYKEGRVPLHTLRADMDFGFAEAKTTYGIIGVKVWVFKGEVLEHDPMAMDKRLATESGPAGEGGGRERSGDRPDRGPRRDRRETAGA